MTTDIAKYDSNDDGFAAAAADLDSRAIKGDILRCSKGHWLVGESQTHLDLNNPMVATSTVTQWVRWGEDEHGRPKPIDFFPKRIGDPVPQAIEELPDAEAMTTGPDGQERPAWQLTKYLHFTDPQTAATYTFITSTWRGREAVSSLAAQIVTMRTARKGVSPVVILGSAPYKTKFGTQMKPTFRITGWVGGNGGAAVEPQRPAAMLPPLRHGRDHVRDVPAPNVSPVFGHVTNDTLDDEVPF